MSVNFAKDASAGTDGNHAKNANAAHPGELGTVGETRPQDSHGEAAS